MTKDFKKWVGKQSVAIDELLNAVDELVLGNFDANLGGSIYKKRIKFRGRGKSKSGRTIICYKKGNRTFFVHGFAKNEKENIDKKELKAFKELAKILFNFSEIQLSIALKNGDLSEVKK